MKRGIKKVVLAYSGGLDTSIILRWIIEEYGAEVVTYTADVGQGDEAGGCRGLAQPHSRPTVAVLGSEQESHSGHREGDDPQHVTSLPRRPAVRWTTPLSAARTPNWS